MTPRVAYAATVALVVAAAAWGLYQRGVHDERARQASDYIEGTQDAQDAVGDVGSRGAAEWLRDTFGGAGGGDP